MGIELLEFEQEPVMSVWRVDDDEFRLWDMLGDLLLFCDHEEPVGLDADD